MARSSFSSFLLCAFPLFEVFLFPIIGNYCILYFCSPFLLLHTCDYFKHFCCFIVIYSRCDLYFPFFLRETYLSVSFCSLSCKPVNCLSVFLNKILFKPRTREKNKNQNSAKMSVTNFPKWISFALDLVFKSFSNFKVLQWCKK